MTARVKQETCARCGHTTPDCDTCGRSWPMLGAGIGGHRLCHTFVVDGPSCYEQEMWTGLLQGVPWVHVPREQVA